jgi:hypothetical protein
MTFDRRRSELEARSLRRLDLPRVYHENQIAELDAHNSFPPLHREVQTPRSPQSAGLEPGIRFSGLWAKSEKYK